MGFGTPEYSESDRDWMDALDKEDAKADRARLVKMVEVLMPTVAGTLRALRVRR
jgi:hypothetical protein